MRDKGEGPAQLTPYKSKQEVLLAFLDKGMVMVHLDARADGVLVPNQFVGQQDLRLNLSYRFAGSEIDVTDNEIAATLTFGGLPFRCRIPLPAIYAVTSHVTGAGLVFPESLPEEILVELNKEIDSEGGAPKPISLHQLTDVSIPSSASPSSTSRERAPPPSTGRATKAPHLRVIEGEKKN